ncbi:N-6 DNA methylase, partial [Novosphingobium taihuense]
CALEQWREAGMKQGIEARKDLYANVATALEELGQGLVAANPDLREKLQSSTEARQALFEEMLRTVYRLIFLAVAEDRDLLHPRRTGQDARGLYSAGYSFGFWRERSRRRVARDAHHDAWEAMKVTLAALEHGEDMLGLPALGGLFASGSTPHLNAARIPNRRFLEALFKLGYIKKDGVLHRINWRDLKTEELGSVYEGLLEIRPSLTASGDFQLGSGAKGNDRKTSGSYYTPDSLVECLLDSALNPVLERAEASGATPEEKVAAILDLKVIDPACGSGHFLLGAARRMADRVARLRNEDAGKEETQAALRDVVSRCIHGVDRNPMAVELAKVALWIESVSPGQPLGFLDANIRCGDALLGVFDLAVLEEGIPDEAYKPLTGDNKDAAKFYLKLNRDAKKGQGSFDFAGGGGSLPAKPIAAGLGRIKSMPEDTVGQVEKKRQAFEAWKADPARYGTEVACDLYMAAFLMPKTEVPLNYQRAMVPTTGDVRQKLAGGNVYGPLEGAAREVAGAASVLHWPLEFPDVMVGKGGFDVVLGNPPWERIKLQEQEFFSSGSIEIATAPNKAARDKLIKALADAPEGSSDQALFASFVSAKRTSEAISEFARVPGNLGGRFTHTGRGDVNTYALFSELVLNLVSRAGRSGTIVPTGICTDANNQWFFNELISTGRLVSLYSFYEIRLVFTATDDRNSFCLMTLGEGGNDPEFAFSILDTSMISDENRRFRLSADDIRAINPSTGTAPIFRSKSDAKLTAKIYRSVSPLCVDRIDGQSNPWGAFYLRLVDFGDHSEELRTKDQAVAEGFEFNGSRGHRGNEVLLPVYESKYINSYNHRFAQSRNDGETEEFSSYRSPTDEIETRYWVSQDFFSGLIKKYPYDREWLIGYRDITNSSAERTTIPVAIPLLPASRNLPILGFDSKMPGFALLANLNAIVLDYVSRQKVGGTHLTFTILKQLPILPPSAYDEAALAFIVPRVLELTYTSHSMAPFARDLGYEGPPFAWDEDRRAHLRAELDAWYALAYGLTRDELRYVLDPKDVMGEDYPSETFRVLQKNEIARHGEYRTRRLVLAAYDELTAQGMRPRTEGWR